MNTMHDGIEIPRQLHTVRRDYLSIDFNVPIEGTVEEVLGKITDALHKEVQEAVIAFKKKWMRQGHIEQFSFTKSDIAIDLCPEVYITRPETLEEYNRALPTRLTKAKRDIVAAEQKRVKEIKDLRELADRLGILVNIPGEGGERNE